jgi:hypothetical protein
MIQVLGPAREEYNGARERAAKWTVGGTLCAIEIILLEHSRILGEHTRILDEHTRILQTPPEVIRERIGFKIPEQQRPAQ